VGSFPSTPLVVRGSRIYVGAASWTDPTFTARGVFYPDDAKTPEGRLRYYASVFPLVEVDSPFYALPTSHMAQAWIKRTPDAFIFDVKAHALMTGHATEVARLPPDLRAALAPELAKAPRLYAKDLPPEIDDEVWRIFRDAIQPLHESGKLGAVLLQFAPWVTPTKESPAMLERARARLGDLPVAVEFRNAAWLSERLRIRTWDLLSRLGISYVAVDEPQGTPTSLPPLVQVTHRPLAVIRLHGQRAETWAARGVPAVERYRYLYSPVELEAWVSRIIAAAEAAERVHVVFNNCYANYGAVNAAEMIGALERRAG
jgi:uncharacterized protein YecE (DUF72 family)